jgi:hypothetical protein
MKKFLGFLTVLLALVAHSAQANVTTNPVAPEKVLSVVTADWNEDGGFDRAVLIETEPTETELLIYLSGTPNQMKLAIRKPDVAWRGGLWGTQPKLEVNQVGSLVVVSGNEAIGRNRWMQKLTIVYRNKSFVVAGYTYNARDTLNLDYQLQCDVNFLTGKGIKNGKTFKTAMTAIPLAKWSSDAAPRECK